MTFKFSKSERLRVRRDFLRLSSSTEKFRSTNFIILKGEQNQAAARLGITVSRKVGNAVTRNRVKRLLREYFRMHKENFSRADYNIIARQGAAALEHRELFRELDRALRRLYLKCS